MLKKDPERKENNARLMLPSLVARILLPLISR